MSEVNADSMNTSHTCLTNWGNECSFNFKLRNVIDFKFQRFNIYVFQIFFPVKKYTRWMLNDRK